MAFPKRKPIEYIEMDALNRRLLEDLMTPQYREDSSAWEESGDRLLEEGVARFWSEHSERSYVNSTAATLGFPKEQRDYLGRWMPEQSDDYLVTSRAVVGKIHRRVAEAFMEGAEELDESESRLKLRSFLRD